LTLFSAICTEKENLLKVQRSILIKQVSILPSISTPLEFETRPVLYDTTANGR